MRYCFDDYTLDPAAMMLTRQGLPTEVPRRVFECIRYLVEHRERAIGRDELILKLWGRPNVSDNQLAQVVLAARRLLADDGARQRFIRTVPGMGYHWTGPVVEIDCSVPQPGAVFQSPLPEPELMAPSPAPEPAVIPPSADLVELPTTAAAAASTHAQPDRAASRRPTSAGWPRPVWLIGGALMLLILAALALHLRDYPPYQVSRSTMSESTTRIAVNDPLQDLKVAFRQARYEYVREGLARLPALWASAPEAHILAIELAIARGRFPRAEEQLNQQLKQAELAADRVWQAQLLGLRSTLRYRMRKPGSDILAPAQQAMDLLDAADRDGRNVPATVLAHALRVRGNALVQTDQLDAALVDISRARNLYQSIGDDALAADLRVSLARVWMRMGRMSEALEQIDEIAGLYHTFQDPIRELFARNTATKIQIELLRWNDALASSDRSIQLLQDAPDSERRGATLQLRALVMTGLGRLREAASLLEEADAQGGERGKVIPAIYHLAAGEYDQALAAANEEFHTDALNCPSNLLLENRDGALLLWVTAVQKLASAGRLAPEPAADQLAILEQAQLPLAHIARGRWLWMQGKAADAESELRAGFRQARQANQLYRMQLAAELLLDLLIERGDMAAATRVLDELKAHDPVRIEQSFEAQSMALRLAMARGDADDIASAQVPAAALAGERSLPTPAWIASTRDVEDAEVSPITILSRNDD